MLERGHPRTPKAPTKLDWPPVRKARTACDVCLHELARLLARQAATNVYAKPQQEPKNPNATAEQ